MEGRTEERKHRQGKPNREKKRRKKNTEGWKDGRKNGRTDRG